MGGKQKEERTSTIVKQRSGVKQLGCHQGQRELHLAPSRLIGMEDCGVQLDHTLHQPGIHGLDGPQPRQLEPVQFMSILYIQRI